MPGNSTSMISYEVVKREWRRLRAALYGLAYAIRSERHCQYHLLGTAVVVGSAVWFHIPPIEAGMVALSIGLVWVAELLNTAIERVVDQRSRKRSVTSKIIKDTAAGAVLVATMVSIYVGLVVFTPYLRVEIQKAIVGQEGNE